MQEYKYILAARSLPKNGIGMGLCTRYLRVRQNHYKTSSQKLGKRKAGSRMIALKRNPNTHNKTCEQC